MIQNPHLICARVLNTMRVSGLTNSLVCMKRPISEGSTQSFKPQPDYNFPNFESQLITPIVVATKLEPDTEWKLNIVRHNNLLNCESELLNLRGALAQLQLTSAVKQEVFNSRHKKENFQQKLRSFPKLKCNTTSNPSTRIQPQKRTKAIQNLKKW